MTSPFNAIAFYKSELTAPGGCFRWAGLPPASVEHKLRVLGRTKIIASLDSVTSTDVRDQIVPILVEVWLANREDRNVIFFVCEAYRSVVGGLDPEDRAAMLPNVFPFLESAEAAITDEAVDIISLIINGIPKAGRSEVINDVCLVQVRYLSKAKNYNNRCAATKLVPLLWTFARSAVKKELRAIIVQLVYDSNHCVQVSACIEVTRLINEMTLAEAIAPVEFLPDACPTITDPKKMFISVSVLAPYSVAIFPQIRMNMINSYVAFSLKVGRDEGLAKICVDYFISAVADQSWYVRERLAYHLPKIVHAFSSFPNAQDIMIDTMLPTLVTLMEDPLDKVSCAAVAAITVLTPRHHKPRPLMIPWPDEEDRHPFDSPEYTKLSVEQIISLLDHVKRVGNPEYPGCSIEIQQAVCGLINRVVPLIGPRISVSTLLPLHLSYLVNRRKEVQTRACENSVLFYEHCSINDCTVLWNMEEKFISGPEVKEPCWRLRLAIAQSSWIVAIGINNTKPEKEQMIVHQGVFNRLESFLHDDVEIVRKATLLSFARMVSIYGETHFVADVLPAIREQIRFNRKSIHEADGAKSRWRLIPFLTYYSHRFVSTELLRKEMYPDLLACLPVELFKVRIAAVRIALFLVCLEGPKGDAAREVLGPTLDLMRTKTADFEVLRIFEISDRGGSVVEPFPEDINY